MSPYISPEVEAAALCEANGLNFWVNLAAIYDRIITEAQARLARIEVGLMQLQEYIRDCVEDDEVEQSQTPLPEERPFLLDGIESHEAAGALQ